MNRKLLTIVTAVIITSLLLLVGCSSKQTQKPQGSDYPKQSIRVVVPYAAGGGQDSMTRAVAKYVKMGQAWVVNNIEGGAAKIGTSDVIKSKPDGYTVLSHTVGLVLGYYAGLYDTPVWKELEPIAGITIEDNAFSVGKGKPWKTIGELVDYARKNPGKVKWGFTGIGGTTHASAAMFVKETGIEVNFVPFNSAADSRAALVGGHVDISTTQISEVISLAKAGDVRILATTGETRNQFTKDIPTMKESGINHIFTMWRGFWAPKGTPQEVIAKLEAAVKQASENPECRKLLEDMTYSVKFLSTEDMKKQLENDAKNFEPLAPLLKAKK